jgi:VanZ family protein
MAMIFFVSAKSTAPLPQQVSDKTAHAAAYAVLAVLAARAAGGGLPRRVTPPIAVIALTIASGYGAFDEVHQSIVPGRSADIADWYADTAGAVIGLGACWAWGMIAVRSDV